MYYLNLKNKYNKNYGEVVAQSEDKESLLKKAKHLNRLVGESGDKYTVSKKPFEGAWN